MFEDFDFDVLDDPDFKEDSVREEIIAPILKRLGYEVSGRTRVQRSKALSHPFVHIGTRKHPVSIVPDYTLWHDDRPLLILDAKKPGEDILHSRHVEQAYSYAIHPEVRCKHFALCNGEQLVIFHVEEFEPILIVEIRDLEAKWADLEKCLAPRYLLNPVLRTFQPDLGTLATKLGIGREADIIFIECRINLLARVSDELYTASSACDFAGTPYLASFDFDPSHLEAILSCLAWPLAVQVRNALSRSPYHLCLDLMVNLDWKTRLGPVTSGADDSFVPFIVTEVIGSRFDRTPVKEEPDIPQYVFRLRRAFETLQSGALNSLETLSKF